jgi:hypothetical protein
MTEEEQKEKKKNKKQKHTYMEKQFSGAQCVSK